MNNNASSLYYWLLPAPRFNDYAFVLCAKSPEGNIPLLLAAVVWGWRTAEQKAGFSCHISSLLFIRVSFFCRRKRTLISYVYSYTNLFKYFQELSIKELPGIPNTSSLFHYSVVLHTRLTWDAVRERPHHASLSSPSHFVSANCPCIVCISI